VGRVLRWYGLAVFASAAALIARAILDPILGDRQPYAMFYAAVAFAAWPGGLGPALLALVAGWLAGTWFFVEPRFTVVPKLMQPGDLAQSGVYAMVALGIALLSDSLRRGRRGAAARQEQLRTSETRFRSLVVATAQVVWTAAPDGLVVEDSPTWRAFTGQTFEEGKGWGWLAAIHPEDRRRVENAWSNAVAQRTNFAVEYRLRRPDGSYSWMIARGTPVLNGDGSVREWIGANTDISERKRAEVERERLLVVAEQARAEAEAASRGKDDFLSMLSHELRNPLAPIRPALKVLRLIGPAEPRLHRAQDMIDRQVQHMTRLLDDLLDVSRITRGKVALTKARVALRETVLQAVDAARLLTEQKGQELRFDLPESGVWVDGDEVRLTQILTNLLDNAAKFTLTGGTITVQLRTEHDEAVLSVRDTGVGIAPEALARIFDLFTQEDATSDRQQGGLGIGLTLVRRLVELHGGRVEAGSPGRGHGSEFVVRLPLARPTMPPVGTEERSEPPEPAATASVLLVEDNVDAAESLVMYLELRGYRVKIAPDGPTALRLAQASPPDAAIVDLGLPGMDGFEVARRLRGDVGLGKMLLVALTGYGSEEDRRRAFAAGFDAHLLKPVDPDVLHALLARDRNGRAVGEKTRTVH